MVLFVLLGCVNQTEFNLHILTLSLLKAEVRFLEVAHGFCEVLCAKFSQSLEL